MGVVVKFIVGHTKDSVQEDLMNAEEREYQDFIRIPIIVQMKLIYLIIIIIRNRNLIMDYQIKLRISLQVSIHYMMQIGLLK